MRWFSKRVISRKLVKKVGRLGEYGTVDIPENLIPPYESQENSPGYIIYEDEDGTRKAFQLSAALVTVPNEDEEADGE